MGSPRCLASYHLERNGINVEELKPDDEGAHIVLPGRSVRHYDSGHAAAVAKEHFDKLTGNTSGIERVIIIDDHRCGEISFDSFLKRAEEYKPKEYKQLRFPKLARQKLVP